MRNRCKFQKKWTTARQQMKYNRLSKRQIRVSYLYLWSLINLNINVFPLITFIWNQSLQDDLCDLDRDCSFIGKMCRKKFKNPFIFDNFHDYATYSSRLEIWISAKIGHESAFLWNGAWKNMGFDCCCSPAHFANSFGWVSNLRNEQ